MASRKPLRVCLDARISDGTHGGVQQVILGLAGGLAALPPGPEEYLFLVRPGQWDWLRPGLSGPCRPLEAAPSRRSIPERVRDGLLGLAGRRGAAGSDGTVERAGVDVVHLTLQDGFRTRIPTVYTPHDLLHVHHPSFFSPAELAARNAVYPDLCRRAAAVMAISRWGKQDLVQSYGLPEEKVFVVPNAPAPEARGALGPGEAEALRARLGLPAAFALYPAQAWPHKNHRALLDALALLRAEGLAVPLVLTGGGNRHLPGLLERVEALGLGGQVRSLGFLPPADLDAVYRLARLVVFPSLFEGFGMPVLEAFRAGVPVACSNATAVPEVAGDAALLFDPTDPSAIAGAIRAAWTDEPLRARLVARGRERVGSFSWAESARRCRALYRLAGGAVLSDDDRDLLGKMR